jgi:anti-sigma factor RsiW
MLWLTKHARLRNKLSPYIDGRLTAAEAMALEAHLASCEACSREVDELRATVSALHDLPQAEAPRSFAIRPEMLERRAAASAQRLPAIGLGMRLAGAAVAVVLAVVLIGDLTVGGGGGASREAGSQPAEESRLAQIPGATDTSKSGESGAYAQPSGNADSSTIQSNARAAAPCAPAGVPPATGSAAGGAAGGAGGPASGGGTSAGNGSTETPAGTATPARPAGTATREPAPTSTPSPQSPNAAICGDTSGGAAAPVAPVTSSVDAQRGTQGSEQATRAASGVNEDGGISTLRVVEIVLAAILIAMLAGIALEAALRRRRVA